MTEEKFTILYVDDDLPNLNLFRRSFRREYNIITSSSASEALQIFKENKIDLLISDQRMPDMTGVEFFIEAIKINPNPNRILLTAYTDFSAIQASINKAHIYSYIQKPWNDNDIKITINNALEAYDTKRENQQLQLSLQGKNQSLNNLISQLKTEIEKKIDLLDQVKDNQKKYKDLLHFSPDAIIVTDEHLIINTVNKKSEEIFGYKMDELIGKAIEILIPKKYTNHVSLRNNYMQKPTSRNIDSGKTLFAQRKNGEVFPVEISLSPLNTKDGYLVSSVIRDISKQKRDQEIIINTNKELEAINEINRMVLQNESLKVILKQIISTFANVCQAHNIIYFGYNRENNVLFQIDSSMNEELIEFAENNASIDLKEIAPALHSDNDYTTLIRDGKGFFVSGNSAITDCFKCWNNYNFFKDSLNQYLENNESKHLVNLPLQTQEGILGMVSFSTNANISDEYRDRVDRLSKQLSLAIYKVYSENRLKELNSELEERVQTRTQELNRTNEKLIKNQYQLESAFSGSGYSWWDISLETNAIHTHPNLLKSLGFSTEKNTQTIKWWYQHLHFNDRKNVLNKLTEHISGKTEIYETKYRLKSKNGNFKWFQDKGKVVERDVNKKPLRLIGTIQDIDDQMQTQHALKESEKRFRLSFEYAAIGNLFTAPDGKILRANKAIAELLGYKHHEITKLYIHDITYSKDLELSKNHSEKVLKGTKESVRYEKRFIRRDGTIVWVDNSKFLLRNEAGEPLYLVCQILDINERKKAEEELKKLSAAVTQSPAVVVITNKNGIIEYVNPAFEKLTGYTSSEAIGKNPNIINAGILPKEYYTKLWQKILSGEIWKGEFCNQCKDGTIFWESATIAPVRNKKNEITHFIAVKEDITERKKIIEELKIAKIEAESASKAKSEFLANMSHEIRTPLNAILGYADILNRKIENSVHSDYLLSIISSGKNLLNIINDILDLSKVEAGKIELHHGHFKIEELLKEVTSIFKIQASDKRIDLQLEINNSVPPIILSDEIRLRQILINLLGNAIKFTDKGYVKLIVRAVKSDIQTPGNELINLFFDIEDTGVGIHPDNILKIFQSFEQQSGQNTNKYGGTGLGLTISKRLANLMKGDISVVSTLNKGSVFTFSIKDVPFSDDNQLPKTCPPTLNHDVIKFNQCNVLVIDDIETNRNYLKNALEELGLTVTLAQNGIEGLKCLKEYSVQLIICDIKMPIMDGYQFISKLRSDEKYKDIACIASTASVIGDIKQKIKEHRFDGQLLKPVTINELIEEIKVHIPHTIHEQDFEKSNKRHLSVINPSVLQENINLLHENLYPIWTDLKTYQSFEKMKEFAEELLKLGNQLKVDQFLDLGNSILKSIDNFDIEKLLQLFNEFDIITENIFK